MKAGFIKRFTLIELLIVIVILAIIAALIMPMFVRARTRARMANDQSNLKQIYSAIMLYAMDNDGALPYLEALKEEEQQSKTLWMLLPYTSYNAGVMVPSTDKLNGHLIYDTLINDPTSLPFPEFAYTPIYQNGDDETDTSLISFKLDRPPFPIVSTYNKKYNTLIILNSTGEVEFKNKLEE